MTHSSSGAVSNLHTIQMGNRAQNPGPYARLGMCPALWNHTGRENTEFYGRGGLGKAAQNPLSVCRIRGKMLGTWQRPSMLSVGKARPTSETFPHPRERERLFPDPRKTRPGSEVRPFGNIPYLKLPNTLQASQRCWGRALLKSKASFLMRCSSDLIGCRGRRVWPDATEMPGSCKTHSRI